MPKWLARKLVCLRDINLTIGYTVQRESLAGRIFGESTIFERLAEKVWRMNRSAKGLSMVAINFDGFSLANRL